MIRKVRGGWRLYSRKKHHGRRRNLGTYKTKSAAKRRERFIQHFRKG